MMNRRIVLLAGSCVVSIGVMTPAANALALYQWTYDCPCSGRSGGAFTCSGDWDTSSNWFEPGYPDGVGDQALIIHSNYGCCSNDDAPCLTNKNCGFPNTCDHIEDGLGISLPPTTTTIHSLIVRTADVFLYDSLEVTFTDGTLSAGWIELDAANGTITIKVDAGGHVKTDGL